MRELERELPADPTESVPGVPGAPSRLVVVGAGRAGGAIARAATAASIEVRVAGRDEAAASAAGAEIVLLCVPDDAIPEACEAVAGAHPPPARVGHVSGAAGLDVLEGAAAVGAAVFSMHPLQTIPDDRADIAGAPCAVSASDADTASLVTGLATAMGMAPFAIAEEDRATYHAAAAMASNFLVTLEESAAALMARAGVAEPRAILAPLVLRSAANWAERGPGALTGPIARGDEATVERHRQALAERAPELVPLHEALADRTRALAREARS